MTEDRQDALRAEDIVKRFGALVALDGVSLHLKKGEVLGLIGDNGAGKSTLIKIITGYHRPDAGRLFVNGEEVHFRTVKQAREHGIETVYQDLALINELSVFHNMFLNTEVTRKPLPLLNNREMKQRTKRYLDDMGVNIPSIDSQVGALSGGQRQAIAVARSVYSEARILLLDEPLAAMGAKEGALILDLVQRLRDKGNMSMILIVHNYAHVFEVCDRVNLLQHGKIAFDKPTSQTSVEELTELVVNEYRKARMGAQ
ncbi:MAG: ATP-binding cassette domain-containing protein [Actinomycetota bacterium]|nr:ATP-binding cassette domain-containing protein [Actinomycetota bacterium]